MKIKEDFLLRQVADSWVILPIGQSAVNFDGMLTLNDSAVMLWKQLQQGTDTASLVRSLTDEFEVDEAQARQDVEEFLAILRQVGCLQEK